MARIHALPSLEIIRGLKGILDFYMWKGLPCVRAWPRYRPAKQTAASLAAALVFGAIVKSYGLLGDLPLEAYRTDALDQTRTARDIMVTGIYGNLHEASMSDFLTLLQESRDFLSQLTALLNALDSIDTDELVVNVDESVLPTGAATAAHQFTQNIALARIDDLSDALQSHALDRLIVRGEDQLHSYLGPLQNQAQGVISGADGLYSSGTPPDGEVWVVTRVSASDRSSATTLHVYLSKIAGATSEFARQNEGWAVAIPSQQPIRLWLEHDDTIVVFFYGGLVGDTCRIVLFGHRMTKE